MQRRRKIKRTFDLVMAVAGCIAAVPVLAIAAVVIRITSPGPAIFAQIRVGRHERPFTCYKLRTMGKDTDNRASHEVSRDAITPIGKFLRKTKLDELPQLWNIVKGDMSFVGPRPCLPSQTALVECRRELGLYQIRPGITGVSQVQNVDMSDPERLAKLDSTYLDDVSLRGDMILILATVTGGGRGDAIKG